MDTRLHWDILDEKRQALLRTFKEIARETFYLAGGTGLALQLGHRDSIDFDFFTPGAFDTSLLVSALERVYEGHQLSITQIEKSTVSCLIDGTVQCSYLGYEYPQIRPSLESEYFAIASIEDIGCMKLSAITSRSVEKDYVDLYFILNRIPLSELLSLSVQKHPSLDQTLILKSLVYFDDVLREPILYKEGHEVVFEDIQAFLEREVKAYLSR